MSDDLVACCPDCGAANVTRHAVGGPSGDHSDEPRGRYRCSGCGAYFDEYDERERRQSHTTRRGLAGKLAAADPDEVGL
ncbi:MAG: hypothetical protein HQRvContig02_45 [Haloquadratum phage sp.]|nr:MAG: hypothetical protein HQRvContig02_45 [Haloquadratum phage sp.]